MVNRLARGANRGTAVLSVAVFLILGPSPLVLPAFGEEIPQGPFLSEAEPVEAVASTLEVSAAAIQAGFSDDVIFSGLSNPMSVRFAADGRIFVAEKSGVIKVFDSLTDSTPDIFADLRVQVHDFWDRGMMSLELHPSFPSTPYVYVMYAFNAPIGGTAPVWGDSCPSPPGATTDGCVVSGRLSRLQAAGNQMTGSEVVLINDWCQQFPSHSGGDLRFGSDGFLYVSGGDGASFGFVDYGQAGGSSGSPTPKNPCGDPPVPVGGTQTPPTAEGGALRSQSIRRPSGEPVSLDGTVIRVDPMTGLAVPNNPFIGHADINAQRIVVSGLRNPFRFTFRPGTNEIWIGDVGWNNWEEVSRVTSPLTPRNLGWPCYEGASRQSGYDSANLSICENFYVDSGAHTTPYYAYSHSAKVVSGESCPSGSSSISGMAFYQGGNYPSSYNGALFFADHSRHCVWAMLAGANGLPDSSQIQTFLTNVNPVDLEIGLGGDLFYVNFEGGAIHRITHQPANQPPTAVISANPTSGATPLTVAFGSTGSSDPDGGTLTYAWDLDGDGQFDDGTGSTANFTYTTSGQFTAVLRVTDLGGLSDTDSIVIQAGNSPPVPVIDTPSTSLRWSVGQSISFSGHATDPEQGTLPSSALSWALVLNHCPSNCHTHDIQNWNGVAAGSFAAPDHEYPSHLELVLTATDAAGAQASTSIDLNPQTVTLNFGSVPSGLQISVATYGSAATPFSREVIVGSANSISATSPQSQGGNTYTFASWSDGGAQTHNINAPVTSTTYTATFQQASGTTSFLSDLAYTVTANGWGPVEKDTSNGESAAGDGLPIRIGGQTFAKGLGVHALSD
ncbi:MAG TPA: PQQ-dependent sugar dehydrogenase, partial [Nitrospiraceae bacterium]